MKYPARYTLNYCVVVQYYLLVKLLIKFINWVPKIYFSNTQLITDYIVTHVEPRVQDIVHSNNWTYFY